MFLILRKTVKQNAFNCVKYFCDSSYKSKTLNVLFFGNDNFSLGSLRFLTDEFKKGGFIKQLGVVTSIKIPSNPVQKYAEKENIQIHRWPLKDFENQKYDIGLVVSFGHLIPEDVINKFPLGMLNVHASLLPRWRGAAPIIYAIKSGDEKTGVSIMRIKPKHFDIGEILAQKEVQIEKDLLMPELHKKLALCGGQLLLKCVREIPDCFSKAVPQNSDEVTYAPKIVKTFSEINWNEMTAIEIYNLYRSLYSFKPITTHWHSQIVKLLKIELEKSVPSDDVVKTAVPGQIEYLKDEKCLRICCKDGGFIRIIQLGVEGKKLMSAIEFNNGFVKKKKLDERFFS